MNEQDIRALLAIAAANDNRRPGEANVAAWLDAAQRGRWTFSAASEAIKEHHTHSTEYLKPAHITAWIRWQRQAPPGVAELEEPTVTADSEHVRQVVDQLAQHLHWDRGVDIQALRVACPWCGAAVNSKCVTGRQERREAHPSRIEQARKGTS